MGFLGFIQPFALPYPRFKIEDGGIKAQGLISINSPNPKATDREIPKENFGEILFLPFDDVPHETLQKNGKTFIGPSPKDLEKALEFAIALRKKFTEPDALLAVHCQAGKSRSAAIALAINAALNPGQEEQVVRSLLQYDPNSQMCFNPRIIALADQHLKTGGALNTALDKHCPPYRSWKKYWER